MNSLKAKGFYLYEEEEKWIGKGVTYGPFQPNERGEPFPSVSQIHHDFESIAAMGANVLRVYTVPNRDFAEMAGEYGLRLLVDIPWPKHLDAYDNHAVRDMCLEMVRTEVQKVKDFTNLAGLILGNEIPSDLVRWAGAKRVENLLRNLLREARSELPDTLIGYANFPGTEFLQPTFFDFVAFNVYLYDSPKFESYLVRLRQMYPHSPLILTEIGYHADSENEEDQAQFLGESLAVAYRVGLAGAFVFSWTDEWHTGGYDITDWSFGLVDVERETKKSFHTVSDVFQSAPQCDDLPYIPKVSVVVATYNGGKTLGQCLESLETVDYPNFEVIVVDDGSTDDTAIILKEHPSIRTISQPNKGLSEARNAGIQASTGEIVAFIDSDCYADPDWLYHIVRQFQLGDFTGVGGPNLTPEEPRLVHQSIALAPGHATHVLFENGDAEHVPGCNMAFLREALIDADGFDPIFRKAGDDVDIAWRLQDLGHRLSFSTAGFVWHHRRSTLRAYIKQQIGYGEAEALLRNKHPQRFNDRGQSIWGGRIYQGLGDTTPLGKPNIQYGIFGSAGYQCIYPPGGSWVYYLMSSIEWWAISLALIVTGLFSLPAMCLGVAGIGCSLTLSWMHAWNRWKADGKGAFTHLFLAWGLWTLQPLIREGARYWFRHQFRKPSHSFEKDLANTENRFPTTFLPKRIQQYWAEEGQDRIEVLRELGPIFKKRGWIFRPNTPWEPWDYEIFMTNLYKLRLTTAEENHGGLRRLLRLRFQLLPTSLHFLFTIGGLFLCFAVGLQDTVIARWVFIVWLVLQWHYYRRACRAASLVQQVADDVIKTLGFYSMNPKIQSHLEDLEPHAESELATSEGV